MCVGWRGGEPHRERNWATVREHYQGMGLRVVASDSDPSRPFLLPQALNNAVGSVIDSADVVVVSDADVLIDAGLLHEAARRAAETGRLVHPLTRLWHMDRDGNLPPEPETHGAGSLHVFAREAWLRLGGYDERHEGWAPHDAAMLWAAGTYLLAERMDADVLHLWHPVDMTGWLGRTAGWADAVELAGDDAPPGYGRNGPRPLSPLALRYREALGDPEAMDVLLREAALHRMARAI